MSTALNEFPGWYIEFQAALLRQAPRPDELDQTTAEGWTSNQKSLKKNLANCLLPQGSAVPVAPAKPELLLDLVGTVKTSATTGKFVAKEKFVRDTSHKAKVKISHFGDNFVKWFLSGDGKIEDPVSEHILHRAKLLRESAGSLVIEELGGEAKAETTLSEMFSLMEKQGRGEDGVLLNNGYANIFYIKDVAGMLRTVYLHWSAGGWGISATSVGGVFGFVGHVFFRNYVLEPSETLAPTA